MIDSELEADVLGAIVVDAWAAPRVFARLPPAAFTAEPYTYATLAKLSDNGELVRSLDLERLVDGRPPWRLERFEAVYVELYGSLGGAAGRAHDRLAGYIDETRGYRSGSVDRLEALFRARAAVHALDAARDALVDGADPDVVLERLGAALA